MPDPAFERALARVYAICEDTDQELGTLAAELTGGQLRSLLADVCGALSVLQWYAVKRLGGIPDRDDAPQETGRSSSHPDGIDWPALYAMADHSATVPEDARLAGGGLSQPV
jgi:hypothetical protein